MYFNWWLYSKIHVWIYFFLDYDRRRDVSSSFEAGEALLSTRVPLLMLHHGGIFQLRLTPCRGAGVKALRASVPHFSI